MNDLALLVAEISNKPFYLFKQKSDKVLCEKLKVRDGIVNREDIHVIKDRTCTCRAFFNKKVCSHVKLLDQRDCSFVDGVSGENAECILETVHIVLEDFIAADAPPIPEDADWTKLIDMHIPIKNVPEDVIFGFFTVVLPRKQGTIGIFLEANPRNLENTV